MLECTRRSAWFLTLLLFAVTAVAHPVQEQTIPGEKPDDLTMFETGRIVLQDESGSDLVFKYRFMRPERSASDVAQPLVVFLHGAGERRSDNRKQLTYLPRWMSARKMRQKHPCFLLAMQCPAGDWWAPRSKESDLIPIEGESTLPMQALEKAIDRIIASEHIDEDRVYLTGLSMGGFGSWHLGAKRPGQFAAVVPICGGGLPDTASRLKDVPVWVVHGEEDRVVPERYSREMVDALHAAGGSVKYTVLEGVPHDSWTPAYRRLGVIDWMFEQVRASSERVPDPESDS